MKYKITNKVRGKTRINLENNEFLFLDNKEEKIVESKPISVTFGIYVEEIKDKKQKIIKEDN
jgi:hypothetical protein